MRIETLAINITDICDMECPFCLRGDRGGRKMNLSLIPKIFEGIDEIGSVVITGGEPAYYPKAVERIVEYLTSHKDTIDVNGFFIATNGKRYEPKLIDAVKTMMCLHMKKYLPEKEMVSHEDTRLWSSMLKEEYYMFGVAVSMDKYHEPIPLKNWLKYRTSGVYSDAKEVDYSKAGVIARGRGEGILGAMERPYRKLEMAKDGENLIVDEIYVTTNGNIYGDCDMSYYMETYIEPYGNVDEEPLADMINRIWRNKG